MKALISITTILLICIFGTVSFAQKDIYIPYREGKQWGICHYNGNVVIAPQFDSVNFLNSKEFDFVLLRTKKKDKTGLVINGKEILKPEYDEITPSYRGFISAKYTDSKGKFTVILDVNGNRIFKEPVMGIVFNEKMDFHTGRILFHVINKSGKEDLAYWDDGSNTLCYLLKDYYSIKLKTFTEAQYRIAFRQKENDPLTDELFYIEDNKLKLIERISQSVTNIGFSIMDGEGSGEGSIDLPPGTGAPGVRGERPDREAGGKEMLQQPKAPVGVTVKFTIENNEAVAHFYPERHGDSVPTAQKIKLPNTAGNIRLQNISNTATVHKTEDYIFHSKTFISFDNKGRKGILIFGNEYVEYDTIQQLSFVNHKEFRHKTSFLVGNRDKASLQMKYSLMNLDLQLIFPIMFDTIIMNSAYGGYDYNYWTVKQNGKYGIITPNGETILPTVYDTIVNKKTAFDYGGNFLELRQGYKYGVFKTVSHTQNILIEPIFEYGIRDIYLNYPYRNGFYAKARKTDETSGVEIIALEDKKKNLTGYANKEGRLYFKNK